MRMKTKLRRDTGILPVLCAHSARAGRPCHWLGLILVTGALLIGGCHDDQPRSRNGNELPNQAKLARSNDPNAIPQKVESDKLQLAAGFWGPMPTGVAVSK